MITLEEVQSTVGKIAAPIINDAGLDLVELTVAQRHQVYLIEVLTDRPQGGINLEECADVNKKIAEALDLSQPWANDYELVVASPGLDRPLKTEKDFRRMLNRNVKVLLTEKIDGKGEYKGLVKEVEADAVVLSVKSKSVKIPFGKIMKAVLNI